MTIMAGRGGFVPSMPQGRLAGTQGLQYIAPMHHFLELFHYPKTLVAAALLGLLAVPALARWFFGDFDTVMQDLGLDNSVGRWAWMLGTPLREFTFDLRSLGFAGGYGIVVLLIYQLLVKLEHWFHLVPA
jgi:hypothetical protein